MYSFDMLVWGAVIVVAVWCCTSVGRRFLFQVLFAPVYFFVGLLAVFKSLLLTSSRSLMDFFVDK